MSYNYVEKYRNSSAKIQSLENELGKLKVEHLACDVERRRLEIELKVKNDELEYLTKKFGFSKDAEAMANARYDQSLEYNKEVAAKVAKLMAEQLDWVFERRKMERKLEVKDEELEELTRKLGFSKDAEADAIKRYELALENNREVDAEVEKLKREFDKEREELLGKLTRRLNGELTEKEVELEDLKEELRGNDPMEIGGNSESDSACESHVDDVKCSSKTRKYVEFAKPTVLTGRKLVGVNGAACFQMRESPEYIQNSDSDDVFNDASNHSDDSSTDASKHEQDAEQRNIQIFVRIMAGKIIAIRLKPSLTIHGLKSKIEDKEGIPSQEQRLIYAGKYLKDRCTLADYNIQKECTINLLLIFRD